MQSAALVEVIEGTNESNGLEICQLYVYCQIMCWGYNLSVMA